VKIYSSRGKSTNGGSFASVEIVGYIIVVGDHDVSVAVSKVVPVGFVKVTSSGRVPC